MQNNIFNEHIRDDVSSLGLRQWLIRELAHAFIDARKNKIKTFNEHQYEVNWQENIIRLADTILSRHYKPSPSISFIIYDPMVREIFAAPFVDRVIHHFLYNISGDWWDRRFIYDSYSCRIGKGTLFGIERIQSMMQAATNNCTKEAYVLKNDIKGYFMSLPRIKVYERVKWGLNQQFGDYLFNNENYQVYHICNFLWRQILLDDPVRKSRRRGPLSHWDDLPKDKSLYNRAPGEGIVIGNQTSQLASNIYLDRLDRYIKYDLGYKWYGRYVDDFIRIVKQSDYKRALQDTKKIQNYLYYELDLTMHPKKYYVQSVYKGVSFLGARIYPHNLVPSNRLQSKFSRAVKNFVDTKGRDAKARETLISYFGLLRHLHADKFVGRTFKNYDLDFNLYLESKTTPRRSFQEILDDLAEDLDS